MTKRPPPRRTLTETCLGWPAAYLVLVCFCSHSCSKHHNGGDATATDTATQSGTTATTDTSTATYAISGVVVDPYIVGASFCEDKNGNGACDDDEQVSTVSDGAGIFKFATALAAGSALVMKEKGTHVGETFTGNMRYSSAAEPADGFVVSPLTTLLASGWTEDNIVSVLTTAGLTGLTAADLHKDPMPSLGSMESAGATDQALLAIRSSLAVEAFLEITAEYMQQTGYVITYAKFQEGIFSLADGTKVSAQELVTRMVTMQKRGLNSTIVAAVDSQLSAAQKMAPCAIPAMTADVFAYASVVINRLVIPRVVKNLVYAPDMTVLETYAQHLGRAFYFRKQADNTCITMGWNMGFIPKPVVGVGTIAELKECKSFAIPEAYKGVAPDYAVPGLPAATTAILACVK